MANNVHLPAIADLDRRTANEARRPPRPSTAPQRGTEGQQEKRDSAASDFAYWQDRYRPHRNDDYLTFLQRFVVSDIARLISMSRTLPDPDEPHGYEGLVAVAALRANGWREMLQGEDDELEREEGDGVEEGEGDVGEEVAGGELTPVDAASVAGSQEESEGEEYSVVELQGESEVTIDTTAINQGETEKSLCCSVVPTL